MTRRIVNYVLPRSLLQALVFCVACATQMLFIARVNVQHVTVDRTTSHYEIRVSSGFPLIFMQGKFAKYFAGLDYYFSARTPIAVYYDPNASLAYNWGNLAIDVLIMVLGALAAAKVLDAIFRLLFRQLRTQVRGAA